MKLTTQILLGFAVVLVLSAIDSLSNYRLSQKVKRNTEYVARSESVIRNSSRLHKTVIEMQSAFRGFLLTDDSTFLDYYSSGMVEFPAIYNEQRDLVKETPSQLAILDSISILHAEWRIYADSLIDAKKETLLSPMLTQNYNKLFQNKLKKQIGKKLNDEISLKFRDFDKYEYEVRERRREQLVASIDNTHGYSLTFIILTVFVGIICSLYIIRIISKRIASMVKLAEGISKGEFTTVQDTKNDELTGLSTSLNIMSGNLQKNIQELEKRNSELNQFAYVVSHDLKAPIRGIYNVVQWIEEDFHKDITPELKKYLDIIPQRTKRMEDLINGLLDYARTREKTKSELINMNDLVKEVADSIVPRAFTVKINPLPTLHSERIKLEQVFSNLISNAVKYMGKPKGEITIGSREVNGFYEFSVKDNGIGIEPEYHEKIFEIFQTLREKHDTESTGIGLSITKKIINDQHGTIHVNSEPGKGAEFIFTWPKTNEYHEETNNHAGGR